MNLATTLGLARSLENALIRLRGIRKARADVAADGSISVEVLAVPEHSERSLRTRIDQVVSSELGSTSSLKALNVLIAAPRSAAGLDRRRKLSSLVTRRTSERFSTQVILARGGDVATGESECATSGSPSRAVAQAVIDGLYEVSDRPLELHEVETIRLGDETLALVSLSYGDRPLLGSAEVRFDLPDAVARATLHALNRSLGHAG